MAWARAASAAAHCSTVSGDGGVFDSRSYSAATSRAVWAVTARLVMLHRRLPGRRASSEASSPGGPVDGDQSLQPASSPGRVDATVWRPVGVFDADTQDPRGGVTGESPRSAADSSRMWLTDTPASVGMRFDSDSRCPQRCEVFVDWAGACERLPPSTTALPAGDAGGGGVGSGALGATAPVLDVGGSGPMGVLARCMGTLACHPRAGSVRAAGCSPQGQPVLGAGVAGMVRIGQRVAGVVRG
jgi:hypothetical protein